MSAPTCSCPYGQPAPGGGYFTIHAETCPMRDWVETERGADVVSELLAACKACVKVFEEQCAEEGWSSEPNSGQAPVAELACVEQARAAIAKAEIVGTPAPDNGLRLALKLADDDLADLADYFRERYDVTDSGAPNEAQTLGAAVHRVRMLHQRIIEGRRPLPTHGYTALGAEGK